ncbi:MAG: ribose 5-phosphate isomerase B [Proteobacteria bacterium]|nr:ribose 5-phosphate isomerase B [Pseudomonadota bacterium]
MIIGLFCDHGGFDLKEQLKGNFKCDGFELLDYGTFLNESVDYPDFSKKAAYCLKNQEIDRAILICGTGIGIAIAANRFPWVRAFVAHFDFEATLARKHNDANAICFSGRYQTIETILPLLSIFLQTPFEGGRHQARIEKMSEKPF